MNVGLDSLQEEYDKLQATRAGLAGQLIAAKEESQPMKDIRYGVSKVPTPKQSKAEKKSEPRHSVTVSLKYEQEHMKKLPKKSLQRKEQNIEH